MEWGPSLPLQSEYCRLPLPLNIQVPGFRAPTMTRPRPPIIRTCPSPLLWEPVLIICPWRLQITPLHPLPTLFQPLSGCAGTKDLWKLNHRHSPNPGQRSLTWGKSKALNSLGKEGWPRLQNEPPGAVPRIHKTKGDGFLGRGRMLDYLWRWSGGRRTRNSFQVGVWFIFPREWRGRAGVCAGSLGPPHTRASRLFTVGYQRLCLAIKFMKRGGVSSRRAGPRSFPTLIRISQGFASYS